MFEKEGFKAVLISSKYIISKNSNGQGRTAGRSKSPRHNGHSRHHGHNGKAAGRGGGTLVHLETDSLTVTKEQEERQYFTSLELEKAIDEETEKLLKLQGADGLDPVELRQLHDVTLDPILVSIYSEDTYDIDLVDLPGLIKYCPEAPHLVTRIDDMVSKSIADSSTVILAVHQVRVSATVVAGTSECDSRIGTSECDSSSRYECVTVG